MNVSLICRGEGFRGKKQKRTVEMGTKTNGGVSLFDERSRSKKKKDGLFT